MKKSELIKNIKSDLNDKYDETTILEILHAAEVYGMLPPTIERHISPKHFLEIGYSVKLNEWESEND